MPITRISLGRQIEAGLDADRRVRRWDVLDRSPDGALRYHIHTRDGGRLELNPGEAADWLNQGGASVRPGRAPAGGLKGRDYVTDADGLPRDAYTGEPLDL